MLLEAAWKDKAWFKLEACDKVLTWQRAIKCYLVVEGFVCPAGCTKNKCSI